MSSRHDICKIFYTSTFANSKKFTRSKRVNCNILDVRYIYIYRNSTACDVCDKYHVCSLHSKINMRIYFKSWTRHYVIFSALFWKSLKITNSLWIFNLGQANIFRPSDVFESNFFCIQVNSFVQLLLKFRLTRCDFIRYNTHWAGTKFSWFLPQIAFIKYFMRDAMTVHLLIVN